MKGESMTRNDVKNVSPLTWALLIIGLAVVFGAVSHRFGGIGVSNVHRTLSQYGIAGPLQSECTGQVTLDAGRLLYKATRLPLEEGTYCVYEHPLHGSFIVEDRVSWQTCLVGQSANIRSATKMQIGKKGHIEKETKFANKCS
jgi:hypothetical protein